MRGAGPHLLHSFHTSFSIGMFVAHHGRRIPAGSIRSGLSAMLFRQGEPGAIGPLVVKGHMPHIAYDKRDYHVEESKAGSRGKSLQRDRDA
jgi:hypothetical protein